LLRSFVLPRADRASLYFRHRPVQKPPYFWRSLLNVFVLLPLLFQVAAIFILIAAQLIGDGIWSIVVLGIPVGAFFLWHCVRTGRKDVRKAIGRDSAFAAEPRFVTRHLAVLLPAAFTLLVSTIVLLRPAPAEGALFGDFAGVFTLTHLPACFLLSVVYLFGIPSPWVYLLPTLVIYVAYGAGRALGFRELASAIRTAPRARFATCAALILLCAFIVWRIGSRQIGFVKGNGYGEWRAENTFNVRHQPFDPDNTLVKIPAPTLRIADSHPLLDGATAIFPVYAAAAQAIYTRFDIRQVWTHIRSSTTPSAYERLVAGEADLVFVAQPSESQRAAAESAGRPLRLTPIGREAFVFFVHADNPIDGLTSEQIRAIYTKRIVSWKELGGLDEKILPFQRPEGSGSQTALERRVMQGEKPAPPLREEFALGMGGVIQQVAAYKNSRAAIGYSFRVFAIAMNPGGEIKLLKIDGVAPTRETIRSGDYPYTVDICAATAGTRNPHVPAPVEWFLGPQGQDLVDRTGYVSLHPASAP